MLVQPVADQMHPRVLVAVLARALHRALLEMLYCPRAPLDTGQNAPECQIQQSHQALDPPPRVSSASHWCWHADQAAPYSLRECRQCNRSESHWLRRGVAEL